jgi:hypothetical protein
MRVSGELEGSLRPRRVGGPRRGGKPRWLGRALGYMLSLRAAPGNGCERELRAKQGRVEGRGGNTFGGVTPGGCAAAPWSASR